MSSVNNCEDSSEPNSESDISAEDKFLNAKTRILSELSGYHLNTTVFEIHNAESVEDTALYDITDENEEIMPELGATIVIDDLGALSADNTAEELERTAVFTSIHDDVERKRRDRREGHRGSDEAARELRKKSDRRFWSRLASLAVIVPAYLLIMVFNVCLPRPNASDVEKRALSAMPEFTWESYWSGQYTADIAHYFDDTVPFCDTLKQMSSRLSWLFGLQYNNVQVSGTMEVVNCKQEKDGSAVKISSVDASAADKSGAASEEIANGVIVVKQQGHYRAMSMYGGGSGNAWVNALNGCAAAFPETKVYSLIAPTASEFYTPDNFVEYNASQEDDILSIHSLLDENVTAINVCPAMIAHKREKIYTRTDHHWTALGAYYAAKEFAESANVPYLNISQYSRITKSDYIGSLYNKSGNNANLLNDPEDFIYYVPKNNDFKVEYYDQYFNYLYQGSLFDDVQAVEKYYSTFLGGDDHSVKIKTSVKNNRRCLVVKDSYGDAFVPFLTGSFEEVYVVDMRYFMLSITEFVKEHEITDLLFTCCSYSAVGENADHMECMIAEGIEAVKESEASDLDNTVSEDNFVEITVINDNDNEDRTETVCDDRILNETENGIRFIIDG